MGALNTIFRCLKRFLPYWKLLVELSLFSFFILFGLLNFSEIRKIGNRFSVEGLVVSGLVYSCGHFLAVASTWKLMQRFENALEYSKILNIYLRRLPAKYLPGGIWHALGRGSDFAAGGVPIVIVGQILLLEQILAIWWSGFLGLLLACIAFGNDFLALALSWVLLSSIMLTVGARITRYRHLIHAVLSPCIALIYVAGWLCLATAFTAFFYMGWDHDLSDLPKVVASYLLSWMIGALAFFSPQGMGVFELTISRLILQSKSDQASFLLFVGSYRIVVLLADMAIYLAWQLYQYALFVAHKPRRVDENT